MKEGLLLKLLMDEVPRTITEIANNVGISHTYCYELLETLASDGAINFRKSAGTWIAWRKHVDASKLQACPSDENTKKVDKHEN